MVDKVLSIDNIKESELIKKLKKGKISEDEISTFLKNNSVDLNKLDKDGYNCLHYAIKTENADIVNLLLTINTDDAIQKDNVLLTTPANPNINTKDDKKEIYLSPLHFTNQEVNDPSNSSKIIKLLIKHGADVSHFDDNGCNILHRAAEKGNVDLVSYILDKHPDKLNSTGKCGSILHMAVTSDHTELVEYLLENSEIDLSILDYVKNSALLLSVICKNFNCFKLILDFIKNHSTMTTEIKRKLINQKNDDGNTILHELAYSKSSVLLEYMNKLPDDLKINVDEKNNKGNTYKDIQNNIVKLIKDKEEEEKRRRESLRQEKQRLIEEKKKLEEEMQLEAEKQSKAEEESKKFQEKILKYRGVIFVSIIVIFMVVLFFIIQRSVNKKKQGITI